MVNSNLCKLNIGHLTKEARFKFLLEVAKVYPDPKDRWNQTPLSESIRFKHLRVGKYLKDFLDQNPNQGQHVKEETDEITKGMTKVVLNETDPFRPDVLNQGSANIKKTIQLFNTEV